MAAAGETQLWHTESAMHFSHEANENLARRLGQFKPRLGRTTSMVQAVSSRIVQPRPRVYTAQLEKMYAKALGDASKNIGRMTGRKARKCLKEVVELQRKFHLLFMMLCQVENSGRSSEAVRMVIQGAYALLGAERVALFRLDEDNQELVCVVSEDVPGLRLPVTTGILGRVATTGDVVNVTNVKACADFNPEVDKESGFRTRTLLCAPIFGVDGKVVAVLQALNKLDGVFTAHDEYLISVVAFFAGEALVKSAMLEEAHRAKRKADSLIKVVKGLGHTNSEQPQDLIDRITGLAYDVVGAEKVTLFLVDRAKEELWCLKSEDIEGWRLPIGQGIAGRVAQSGEVMNIRDAQNSEFFNKAVDKKTGHTTNTVLCVPIFDDRPSRHGTPKQAIAVLQVLNSANGFFSNEDVELLQAFSQEAGAALRAKSYDLAVGKAYVDEKESAMGFLSSFLHHTPRMTSHAPGGRSAPRISVMYGAPLVAASASEFERWDLDVFGMSDDEKVNATVCIFQHFNLLSEFRIDEGVFRKAVHSVLGAYHDHPFHNAHHGFSVMHVTFLLLVKTPTTRKVLSLLEIFSVLLAALCHDVDHPGVNNTHLIKDLDEKALRYNDISVLENHHAATAFRILLAGDQTVFSGMSERDCSRVRKCMIQSILATDMAHHFDLVTAMQNSLDPNSAEPENRELLRRCLVHMADLSAQVMPSALALKWGDRIVAEFRHQAALEREKGLEVEPMMAGLDTEASVGKLQLNFVDYIVSPLWTAYADHFPDPFFECLENLAGNRDIYETAANSR